MAAEILAGSPAAVRGSLTTMEKTATIADPIEAIRASTAVLDDLIASKDTLEGITAFVMKRTPNWSGT